MILFGLSVLSWAFVLSGLTMNISNGFVAGHRAGASVVGINDMTMNKRLLFRVLDSAFQHWRFGSPAQIPSGAALYTQPGSTIIANISTHNTLPADASEGVFLTP
jgi:hypothetical protein